MFLALSNVPLTPAFLSISPKSTHASLFFDHYPVTTVVLSQYSPHLFIRMITSFLYQWSLYLHVIAGFISLTAGLVAMIARKGQIVHHLAGKWFFAAMTIVFWTTVLFFLLDPFQIKYHFFMGIAAISYYPVFTGKRVLGWKKGIQITWGDWIRRGMLAISGILMLAYGAGHYLGSWNVPNYAPLFLVFGGVSLSNVWGDWQVFTGRRPFAWLVSHGGKMVGGYSAAVTAFCVNVVPRYLPDQTPMWVYLAAWIVPGIVIGLVGGRLVRRVAKVK